MADAVRCDNCSTHADRPGGRDPWSRREMHEPPRPANWVVIAAWVTTNQADTSHVDDTRGEFCSWACAAAWLTRAAVERSTPGVAA